VWDGRRFVRDRTGVAERLAKETVRAIYGEVTEIADDDDRRATARWAIASETAGRIRAMLELAASELGVPVVPEQLDANPWVLNCLNGTVDLRTGKLGPHRREDLITKLCPVPYHPCARLPFWEEFLASSRHSCSARPGTRSQGTTARRCCSSSTAPRRPASRPSSKP
jgi:putative DNA primase/helicase